MKKEEIEFKLRCIEYEEEMAKKHANWNKKNDRFLLVMGIALGIFILVTTGSKDSINVLDVFSIALLVSTMNLLLRDIIHHKHDDNHKLAMLDLDKRFYTVRLKGIESEEVDEL
ncbi:MAG: hypothetical protein ACRDB9_10235 [Cetobacterium sp.]